MISTRDLSRLPNIASLKALMQSLAMLDAILADDWESRYYSFDARWSTTTAMASMRDGSGDELYALFMPWGAIIKGFAHESAMSPYSKNPPAVWPGVLDTAPSVFAEFLNEPAFSPVDATFCIWRLEQDIDWQCGTIVYPDEKDPDGSESLLEMLDGRPETYQAWAEYYYDHPVNVTVVKQIYAHQPLTKELVATLNPKASWRNLLKEAKAIGYA
jgi:hypothetical protein